MVSSSTLGVRGSYRFVIRPNQSLSWQQAKLFMALICSVSMTIALAFTLLGFWPILPFAGLELLGLGVALYLCALGNRRCQVVTVEENRVTVQKGVDRPQQTWVFTRQWTKVLLESGRHDWYPGHLWLRSQGQKIEIGEFLSDDERVRLAGRLGRVIADSAA